MDPAPPTLRRATSADAPAVRALVDAVLAEFGLRSDPAGTDADLADLDRHYLSAGGDFAVLVDDAGRIVGTCGLHPVDTPEGVPRTVELRKMYLEPSLRGRGQGRRLLDWALTRARQLGFGRMTLETATVLKDARRLYERHGFLPDPAGVHSCRCDLAYGRDL